MLTAHLVSHASEDGAASSLGLVFPLSQSGDVVVLSETTWISPALVLPKGTELITIYMLPREGDTDLARQQGLRKFDQATADRRGLPRADDSAIAALRQRAERTVWRDINQFRGMLQAIDRLREDAFIVYREPNSQKSEHVSINFPEGALWVERGNSITALWTRQNSRAQQLGITQGNTLLAVNGQNVTSLKQADELWRSGRGGRKTWRISRGGTIQEIDFGGSVSLETSALDAW